MAVALEKDQAAILSRALAPESGTLSPEAAELILSIELSADDQSELRRLTDSAQEGSLSIDDSEALDSYRHVGRLLELLKSKAKQLNQTWPFLAFTAIVTRVQTLRALTLTQVALLPSSTHDNNAGRIIFAGLVRLCLA